MIGFCKNCPKRDTCTKLCATAAEYADQDYVGQHDAIHFGKMDFFSEEDRFSPEYGDIRKEILNHLTKRQKEVVLFYFNEGLSLREIGFRLSIHFTTVKEHIDTAIIKLKKELGDEKKCLIEKVVHEKT